METDSSCNRGVHDTIRRPQLTLIAGGDIDWSPIVKAMRIYYDRKAKNWWERAWNYGIRKLRMGEGRWMRVPYVATPQSKTHIEKQFGRKLDTPKRHYNKAIKYGLKFSTVEDRDRYPFQKIRPVLQEADIAFANLETPLSDNARYSGAFRTPTSFAKGLKWAGIDVVSTANNHTLDAEGAGLLDTKAALLQANIGAVGTGQDLMDARRPFVVERKGITLAFLGYAQAVNNTECGFAGPACSGAVPLDPFLIKEDIQRIRDKVDFVVISFHWGIENWQRVHSAARNFAHAAIDAGADIILGHHPHVPRGIEAYNEKVIIYSLGNFIFGHNHDYWMDNYLARLVLRPGQIEKVEIIPISGRDKSLSQPCILKGKTAHTLLKDIQMRTKKLNTKMEIQGDVGIITVQANECR